MSSCVCKISFKSVQVCGGCCKMFRGLTFWDTVYTSGTVDDAILPLVVHAKATQIGRLLK